MEEVDFTWWAVLVATLVPVVLGAVWYSPVLFAERWMRALGKTREELSSPAVGYVIAVVAWFLMAYVLARVVEWAEVDDAWNGLLVGAIVWLGFVATVGAVTGTFQGRSWTLFAIDGGYHFLSLAGMGVILGAWH